MSTNNPYYKPPKEKVKAEPEAFLQAGISKNYIFISQDKSKITYNALGKTYNFNDPEEKIRASFYVELIEKYKYPEKRVDTEVDVPRRTPSDSADIVVYEDDAQKKPYTVVECKKDGISQFEINQAIEQVFGNANSLRAQLAIVVAGGVRIAFDVAGFDPREREKNIISDIPVHYGKIVKFKFKKGDPDWDLKPANLYELQSRLQQCHDILWQGGRRNPAEAFDEMSKLMFCKDKDERVITPIGEVYSFQIGSHETVKEVADRIRNIYKKAQAADPLVFEAPIRVEDETIYNVVEKLQGISLSKTELDAKGKAFETFLGKIFRGEMGQYFTPRTIVQFIVDLLKPSFEDTLIDPACGSGGFLLYALDKIRQEAEQKFGKEEGRIIWKDRFALYQLYGIEINSLLARVSMMNMIIHEDGHSNIENSDALANPSKFHPRRDIRLNKYSLLLTNPPFGAVINEREHSYLKNYILGGKERRREKQKTEILFLERCIDFLAPGGHMGIVLPDGILTNSSLKYVRDFIYEKAKVIAVVSLPQLAFKHVGAGAKPSLIFLQKLKAGEKPKGYKVFMAIAEHVGHDATGRLDINDLPEILDDWRKFKYGNYKFSNNSFVVNSEDLNDRLDPYYYQKEFVGLFKTIRKSKWQTINLGEVSIKITTGKTPAKSQYKKQGIPIVKVQTIVDGSIKWDLASFVDQGLFEKAEKAHLENGDILVLCSAHSPEYVGSKVGIVTGLNKVPAGKAMAVGELIIIRLDKKRVNPKYAFEYLKTANAQFQFRRCVSGQTAHIYPTDVAKIQIPLPPLSIQDDLAEELRKIEDEIGHLEKRVSEYKARKSKLLADIIVGKKP